MSSDSPPERKSSALTLLLVDQLGTNSLQKGDLERIEELCRGLLEEQTRRSPRPEQPTISDLLWALYLDPQLCHLRGPLEEMAARNRSISALLRGDEEHADFS